MFCSASMLAKLLVLCCFAAIAFGVPLQENWYDLNEEIVAYDDQLYSYNPETPQQRAESLGYSAESYEIVTEDGYILKMFRITGSEKSPKADNKPPVLLLHGLLDCASGWVVACREKSLAFLLADAGYDVWLGNARGNRYAREHKWMTTREKKYWLFSWHEIGMFDIPAMIDHVLEVSKQKKLMYVGHSQGTTSFFVMASSRPEYQQKVEAMFALGPVAFMNRVTNPLLKILAPFANNIKKIGDLIGIYEFMPTQGLIHKVASLICKNNPVLKPLCDTQMIFLAAFGEKLLNTTLLLDVVKYDPAGASTRQFVHYAQLINSGKFRQYDYGWLENLKKYGSISPPNYPVENIDIPIYLHYCSKDMFAPVANVHELYKKLPNCEKFLVPNLDFSHVDFAWGKPVDTLVYFRIMGLMEKHRKRMNADKVL